MMKMTRKINWYSRVANDLAQLPNAIDYFMAEYEEAKYEVQLRGSLEKQAAAIPGQFEHRFAQIQEIEAILEHLNIELKAIRSKYHRQYLEHYQRALTSRDIDRYIDGELEVVDMCKLINEFALVRNTWIGISKAFSDKSYKISDIVKLRTAGFEDASV